MSHSLAPTAVIPIEATLLVLGLVTALGRLIPRFLHRQSFTVSDCFLIASIGNAVALFITDVMTYRWGGMGESDASSDALAISLKKVQFAGNYFYDTGIYLPKLAIVALYFRLFPPTKPWLRKALYLVSGFTLASMVTTCFLDTFWCGRDVSVNWSLDPEACSTFNSKVVFRIDWVMNITTDLLICALPFPLLHQLQLNRRQFWGLIVTFSLGVITIVVSVIRFATIEVIQAWTNVFVLSMAETAVAIMVVSLPSMRGYLRGGRFFSSRQTYGHSSSDRHLRTPNRRSTSNNRRPSTRSPSNEDDTGSEIELNAMDNKNVIVETHEITVESAPATDNDRVAFGQ